MLGIELWFDGGNKYGDWNIRMAMVSLVLENIIE